MTIHRPIVQFIFRQMLEHPARKQSYDDLIRPLEQRGQATRDHPLGTGDSSTNREQHCYILDSLAYVF